MFRRLGRQRDDEETQDNRGARSSTEGGRFHDCSPWRFPLRRTWLLRSGSMNLGVVVVFAACIRPRLLRPMASWKLPKAAGSSSWEKTGWGVVTKVMFRAAVDPSLGRTHAFDGRTGKGRPGLARSRKRSAMLRAKLSALSLSCFARKASDFQSIENPARRIRLALVRTPRPTTLRAHLGSTGVEFTNIAQTAQLN